MGAVTAERRAVLKASAMAADWAYEKVAGLGERLAGETVP